MVKEEAINSFWSSFSIPAYEENTVFAMAEAGWTPTYPYITYEVRTGSFGAVIPLTATLWYRSVSWVGINAKKTEIAAALENGGIALGCDDGFVRLYRSDNFASNLGDPSDDMVKKVVMNYTAEFFTET